jgi:hypothetical protein
MLTLVKKSLLYYNICLKNAIVIQYLVKKSHFNVNVAKYRHT